MKLITFLIGVFVLFSSFCFAGDVKTSTVTVFNYSTGNYQSYDVRTEGNVTEIFSWQNANTVRIEQTSPGEFEIFDYGGRGLDGFDFIEGLNE